MVSPHVLWRCSKELFIFMTKAKTAKHGICITVTPKYLHKHYETITIVFFTETFMRDIVDVKSLWMYHKGAYGEERLRNWYGHLHKNMYDKNSLKNSLSASNEENKNTVEEVWTISSWRHGLSIGKPRKCSSKVQSKRSGTEGTAGTTVKKQDFFCLFVRL